MVDALAVGNEGIRPDGLYWPTSEDRNPDLAHEDTKYENAVDMQDPTVSVHSDITK